MVHRLEGCISDIGHWMLATPLKLNAVKSELIWSGSRYNLNLLGSSGSSLQLGVEIETSDHVRLLGMTIAADLGLDMHLANVCKKFFFHSSSREK